MIPAPPGAIAAIDETAWTRPLPRTRYVTRLRTVGPTARLPTCPTRPSPAVVRPRHISAFLIVRRVSRLNLDGLTKGAVAANLDCAVCTNSLRSLLDAEAAAAATPSLG